MSICLGKGCSFTFGLLCGSFVNVYQICLCPSHFGIEDGMWDV